MEAESLNILQEHLLEVYHGLSDGTISFSFDRCNAALGVHPSDIYAQIVDKVFMKLYGGKEVSVSELTELHDSLKEYNETYEVDEVEFIIDEIQQIIGNGNSEAE